MSNEIQKNIKLRPNVGRRGSTKQVKKIQESIENLFKCSELYENECSSEDDNDGAIILNNIFSNKDETRTIEESLTKDVKSSIESTNELEGTIKKEKPPTLKISVQGKITQPEKAREKLNKPSVWSRLITSSNNAENSSGYFPQKIYNKKPIDVSSRQDDNDNLTNKYDNLKLFSASYRKRNIKDSFENKKPLHHSGNNLSVKNVKYNGNFPNIQICEKKDQPKRILQNRYYNQNLVRLDASYSNKYGERKFKAREDPEKTDESKKAIDSDFKDSCNSTQKSERKNNRNQSNTNNKPEINSTEKKNIKFTAKVIPVDKNKFSRSTKINLTDRETQTENIDLLEKGNFFEYLLSLIKKQTDNSRDKRKQSYTIINPDIKQKTEETQTNYGDSWLNKFYFTKYQNEDDKPDNKGEKSGKDLKKLSFKSLGDLNSMKKYSYDCFLVTHSVGINADNQQAKDFKQHDLLPSKSNETYVIPKKCSSEPKKYFCRKRLSNIEEKCTTKPELLKIEENERGINSETNKVIDKRVKENDCVNSERNKIIDKRNWQKENKNYILPKSLKSTSLIRPTVRKKPKENECFTLTKSTTLKTQKKDKVYELIPARNDSLLNSTERMQNECLKKTIDSNSLNNKTNENNVSEIKKYVDKNDNHENKSENNKKYHKREFIDKNIMLIKTINQENLRRKECKASNDKIQNKNKVNKFESRKKVNSPKLKSESQLQNMEPLGEKRPNICINNGDQIEFRKNENNKQISTHTLYKTKYITEKILEPKTYYESQKKHYLTKYRLPESDYENTYTVNYYGPTNENMKQCFKPNINLEDSTISYEESSDEDSSLSALNPSVEDKYEEILKNKKKSLGVNSNKLISKENSKIHQMNPQNVTKLSKRSKSSISPENDKVNMIMKNPKRNKKSITNEFKFITEEKNNKVNRIMQRSYVKNKTIITENIKREFEFAKPQQTNRIINNISRRNNVSSVIGTNDVKSTQNNKTIKTESYLTQIAECDGITSYDQEENETNKFNLNKNFVLIKNDDDSTSSSNEELNTKIENDNLVMNEEDNCGVLLKSIDNNLKNNLNSLKKITIITKTSFKPSQDDLCWKGIKYHDAEVVDTDKKDKKRGFLQWMKSWF